MSTLLHSALALKSIPLQNQRVLRCAGPLGSTSHGTVNMLPKMRASQRDGSAMSYFILPILSVSFLPCCRFNEDGRCILIAAKRRQILCLCVVMCSQQYTLSREQPPRPRNVSGRQFHLLMKLYQCIFCNWAVSGCQSGEINKSADCTAGNYRVQLEQCCVKPGRYFKLTSVLSPSSQVT